MNLKSEACAALALVALALAGCRRADVRTFTVDIPGMTAADRPVIEGALAPYGGVDRSKLKFDFSAHTLEVSYESMQIAKKNIEMAIAAFGFTANGVTPESVGAKPRGK